MARSPLKSLLLGTAIATAVSTCVLPSTSEDKPADKYGETGNVLSTISRHEHFYQIATDSKVYLLPCTKVKSIQFGEPECKPAASPSPPATQFIFG